MMPARLAKEPPSRRRTSAWTRAVPLSIALAGVGLAAPATAADQERVGLVISGGVSEGNYQAGVTYALMKYLVLHRQHGESDKDGAAYPALLAGKHRAPAGKRAPGLGSDGIPSFDVAAGASAGNINSFLAALTWCADDKRAFGPRENLFWDSWMNVGWDKLSPADPRGAAYKELFADSLSTGKFREIKVQDFAGKWPDDKSVYTPDDGLVTRAAFAAVQENLRRRLEVDKDYRDCVVRVGLTATRARADRLHLDEAKRVAVAADRFVVPLQVGTSAGGAVVQNAQVNLSHVGLALALPVKGGTAADRDQLPFKSVLTLLQASAAFPIAFGPVPMDHCRRPGDRDTTLAPDVSCPAGWEGTRTPFIDGGIFDNQPFGLAYGLAAPDGSRPVLFYIDTSPVRHALVGRAGAQATNGIALVQKILGARIGEARGYENLAAATDQAPAMEAVNAPATQSAADPKDARQVAQAELTDEIDTRAPQVSSRFFPIVGNRLIDSFGSFMHPSFRVYDYFVGVYDGVYTVAQALELDADELKVMPVSARRAPTKDTFEEVAKAIIGEQDKNLRTFVTNLFDYERSWTGLAGMTREGKAFCHVAMGSPPSPETGAEDAHVALVFEKLCNKDADARRLERQGKDVELSRKLAAAGEFKVITKELPELLGDEADWAFKTEDRAVRRTIDVERAAHLQNNSPRAIEYAALGSRYFAAAFMERGDETWDLDPSTVERIAGESWSLGRFISHFLPYYLAWDSVHSRGSIGWEPKLRLTKAFYLGVGADLGWYTHETGRPVDQGTPTKWELRSSVAIAGWDPKDRWVDDVQLNLTMSSPLARPREWRSVGLELAVHPLGSKFRVSVGLPDIRHHGYWTDASDVFSAWFLSIGLSDLNGSLYWGGRSALGALAPSCTCEEYCDGPAH